MKARKGRHPNEFTITRCPTTATATTTNPLIFSTTATTTTRPAVGCVLIAASPCTVTPSPSGVLLRLNVRRSVGSVGSVG